MSTEIKLVKEQSKCFHLLKNGQKQENSVGEANFNVSLSCVRHHERETRSHKEIEEIMTADCFQESFTGKQTMMKQQ